MKLSIIIDDSDLRKAAARLTGSGLRRGIARILEKRGNDARREAVKSFISHGIGRGIFGRNDSGAWKIIKLSRTEDRGDVVSVSLEVGGLAALQDQGGRTRAHVIAPKRRKALAFGVAGGFGFGGERIFAAHVDHPGGAVKKYPFSQEAAEKAGKLAAVDIDRLISGLWTGRAA